MEHRAGVSFCGTPTFELRGRDRCLVHRVVLRDGRAVGVEYERKGQRHIVNANREIILSAGAYGTPHLLQLSGIGAADHLRTVGITPAVESPKVGSNLTDHPAAAMSWDVRLGFVGLSDAQKPQWLLRWILRRTGKFTSNAMEAIAQVRSDPGLPAPDFQLIHSPQLRQPGGNGTRAASRLLGPAVLLDAKESRYGDGAIGGSACATGDPAQHAGRSR